MAKRTTDWPAEDGSQAYLKRQKIKHVTNSIEEIQSSNQLQQLLAFDQNIGRAKHGDPGLALLCS
jgi:nucleolar pre-ribosomal-associated protein 1